MKLYPRKCDTCGSGMKTGYYDAGQYYCSDNCLIIPNRAMIQNYSMRHWEKEHKAYPDECYHTEWEELDDEAYLEDGTIYEKDNNGNYIKSKV